MSIKERIYRIWEAILPGEIYETDTERSIFEILDQIHAVMVHLLAENSGLKANLATIQGNDGNR